MLSKGFKIVSPKVFEVYVEDVNITQKQCIIKVNKAAICKADMRYYLGDRDENILGMKYPMNLLHECIGTVIKDYSQKFSLGDKVVLIPNIIHKCLKEKCAYKVCKEDSLGQNYCPNAKFASSNCDGFSKDIVALPHTNIVKIESYIEDNIAVFSELISVCVSALRRYSKIDSVDTVSIWGDGILSYIMCGILKFIYNKKIIIFGKHKEKLDKFPCDECLFIDGINKIPANIKCVIECVGGAGVQLALNQILNYISPGGCIVLTGVSENGILVNTRKILEKGIILTGSTRSCPNDFKQALEFLSNAKFRNHIKKLIIGELEVKNITDFYSVFEKTKNIKSLGKYIINFCF